MSKTWSTALVISMMLVLMLVIVPSSGKQVGTVIGSNGATVFIGEEGLDMTPIFGENNPVAYTKPVSGFINENNTAAHPVGITGVISGESVNGILTAYDGSGVATISGTITGEITGTFSGSHTYLPPTDIVSATITGTKGGYPFTGTLVGTFNNPGIGNFTGTITGTTNEKTYSNTTVGWWASGATITGTAPKTIELGSRYKSMSITSAEFVGYTGNWYHYVNGAATSVAFYVADPQIDMNIWDSSAGGQNVNGKAIVQGINLTFRINTNLYSINDGKRSNVTPGVALNPETDGFVTIKVKSESGSTYNKLINVSHASNSISDIFVDTQPFTWKNKWATGHVNGGNQYDYPPGTYYVYAESTLNNMKENYRNGGADYTGKTVSPSYAVTLTSDTVKLVANKETVVRGKPFSVTLTGKPNAAYHVWIKGISSMNGTGFVSDTTPPQIVNSQEGVEVGVGGNNFYYENSGGETLAQSVPNTTGSNPYFALVRTNNVGVRTIEFSTSSATKAQKYTIRVETDHAQYASAQSDEVDVNVEKGAVTIVAAGDQSYYLGEEIKLSGTNSESYTTYLFIVGPNLPSAGAKLSSPDPRQAPVSTAGYTDVPVNGDNTWSFKWGTATVALDAGTYTIYAVNIKKDADSLSDATYGTTSIVLKKPFVSASVSSSVVAQGDSLKIVGIAEGNPSQGVAIWIMGKNYNVHKTQSVSSDASFKYDVSGADTKTLATGQYFVVVQHPMQNNKFDIVTEDNTYVKNLMLGTSGTNVFKLNGAGSLQGSDAANALIEAIGDPNIDDTYTKFQFLVETPYIYIAPVGDKHIGDKFTIKSTTNLAVDDQILVEVYSSSFKPTQKSQSGEFSGATGTVKVVKGEGNNGLNAISFDVDSATFRSDEYIVKESAVVQEATGSALFNVIDESLAPIATPTAVVAPIIVTEVPTPIPTTVEPIETVNETPVKPTQASPGFAAIYAAIGLMAVGFVIARRDK